jgi:hypothetical protein
LNGKYAPRLIIEEFLTMTENQNNVGLSRKKRFNELYFDNIFKFKMNMNSLFSDLAKMRSWEQENFISELIEGTMSVSNVYHHKLVPEKLILSTDQLKQRRYCTFIAAICMSLEKDYAIVGNVLRSQK